MNARASSPLFLACAALVALCASCGGGSGGGATAPGLASPASITARFSFTVPAMGSTTSASATQRRVTYISPSSQSLEISIVIGTTTTVGATINLSPLPTTCSVSGGVTQCDVAVIAPASVTSFVITFYDQPNAQGNVLSTATVAAPPAVNGVATIAATLLPVVASIALTPVTPLVSGQAATSAVTVSALDADGNAITGSVPFSAPVQLVPASSAIVFTPSSLTSPATAVTVTYSGAPNADTHVTAMSGATTYVTQLPIGGATPTPAPEALTITPPDLQLTVGGPSLPIVVSQAGTTGSITLTTACNAGAAISLSPTTVPVGTATSVTVAANAAPTAAVTHACTITATSGTQTATSFVDVNQNTATITSRARSAR